MKFVYGFIKTYLFVNRHLDNNDHLLCSELTVPIDRNATSQVKNTVFVSGIETNFLCTGFCFGNCSSMAILFYSHMIIRVLALLDPDSYIGQSKSILCYIKSAVVIKMHP